MRCPKFMLLVVAAILMGAANMPPIGEASAIPIDADAPIVANPAPVTAATVDPSPADPAGLPVGTGAVGVAMTAPPAFLDVGQIAVLVQSPAGILLITAELVYLLLEILKGLVRSADSWSPARKRAIALLGGAGIGSLLSLAGPTPWWIGLIAGLVGSGIPVGGRAIGIGLRGGSKIVVAVIAASAIAAGGISMYACSAAQVKAWKTAGIVGAQCYAECGIDRTSGYLQKWENGTSINGEDVGWDALSCLWPCLAQAGGTLIPALTVADAGSEATSSASSALTVAPDQPQAAICRIKPETMDNSKAALVHACGCGSIPRCSIVVRTTYQETAP